MILLWLLTSLVSITSVNSSLEPINTFMKAGYGYSFSGEGPFNFAGLHVYGVGDINNDSFDDFIIGASQYGGSPTNSGYGKAYLLYGRPTSQWTDEHLGETDVSFIGEALDDTLGRWIAGLGDINGDNFDDFAISAVGHGNWSGKTYVFFGGSTNSWGDETPITQANASFIGQTENDHSGHGIYGVGDVNNDGFNDIMISGEWNDEGGTDAGQVYLIFGRPTNQWTKDAQLPQGVNASFIGNTTIQWLGFDAAGIGDINNDGYDDLAIGGMKNTTTLTRQVFIVLGRQTSQWQMDQPISEANASLSFEEWEASASNDWISGVDDVNGDGYDDFLIGTKLDDTGGMDAGAAHLYFGGSKGHFSRANVSFIGDIPGNYAGFAVAGAGDVNNDGFHDLLIGGVNVTNSIAVWGGTNEGRVYLFLGRPTNQWQTSYSLSTANYSFEGENPGDSFGSHVAGVGDVNNDGFSDIIMSAVHCALPNDGPIAGKTYLVLGNTTLAPPITKTTITTTTIATSTTTIPISSGTAADFFLLVPVVSILALIHRKRRKNS